MTQAELERRLLALERQTPARGAFGAPGISTAFGAASTVYRDHFPAELTSSYAAATGYDWKRRVLDRGTTNPILVNPTVTESGQYAFTPDNDQTLAPGDEGYLLAEPNGGGWIFLHTGATPPAAGACVTGCGSLVGLATDATLRLQLVCATGSFAAIDTDQFIGVYAFGSGGTWTFKKWVDGSPGSWTTFTLDWGGSTGSVVFTWNATILPSMTLGGTGITLRCIGEDGTFSAGPRNGITGDGGYTPGAECESNELVLRVSCSCTPPDGWEGDANEGTDTPGSWYCADQGDGTEPLLLTEDDICDDTLTIDSGPHANESAANAACGPITVACGAGGGVPRVINLSVFSTTDGGGSPLCHLWNGFTLTATWTTGKTWVGNFTNPGTGTAAVVTIKFDADVAAFPTQCTSIQFSGSCGSPLQTLASVTYGPFTAVSSWSSFCCDATVVFHLS